MCQNNSNSVSDKTHILLKNTNYQCVRVIQRNNLQDNRIKNLKIIPTLNNLNLDKFSTLHHS